jgi:adenylosuccinate lyase
MQRIFSENFKFRTWRECWVALAECEMELGLGRVTPEMVTEMKAALQKPIDYAAAEAKEAEVRHDVMAHAYEFGLHCPKAKGIIHLGATSMEVDDNTVLIQQREALKLVKASLVNTVNNLAVFADKYKDMATLGFTHYQPAQPTTVGKRHTLYIQDLLMDLRQIENAQKMLVARGVKGATGTQDSFLELFGGDHEKVKELDRRFAAKLGFNGTIPVAGQTYTRKLDTIVATAVAGVGASAYKFGSDLRLLANMKEQEEPREKGQTGSSAMAYKRNPMRSERMCGLSRKLIPLPTSFGHTHANQWLERTLDDSVIRRMDIAETFLLADAVLTLYQNITKDMIVYPAQIMRHLYQELPFMATERLLMRLVKRGGDRQALHEAIKRHAVEAGRQVKEEGRDNPLFQLLMVDPMGVTSEDADALLKNPGQFTGRAKEQVKEFLAKHVRPVLRRYKGLIGKSDEKVRV